MKLMEKQDEKLKTYCHHAASCVGGFLGAYALLNCADIFGSSQTSNMIRLICGFIMGAGVSVWLIRLGILFVYISALVISEVLKNRLGEKMTLISPFVTFICAAVLAFLPKGINYELNLYPIFFASAFQWNSYPEADGFYSATIFSTNNLKQAMTAATDYIMSRRPESARKMKCYLLTIMYYHIGVVYCAVFYVLFKSAGIWAIYAPTGVLLYFVNKSLHTGK